MNMRKENLFLIKALPEVLDVQDGSVRKTPVTSEQGYWVHDVLISGIIFMHLPTGFGEI
jgi:hypothetical protein